MSFGYSIGDFVAVLELAHAARKRFANEYHSSDHLHEGLQTLLSDLFGSNIPPRATFLQHRVLCRKSQTGLFIVHGKKSEPKVAMT